MSTNTIETKKTLRVFIEENFYWGINAWPIIFIIKFITLHALLLSLFPLHSSLINAFVSSAYQIIGGGYILVQINENLKTLKNIDLLESLKKYWKNKPKRIQRITTHHLKAQGISCKSPVFGMPGLFSGNLTVEEKIELLSSRIDKMDEKLNANYKELSQRFNKNHQTSLNQIANLRQEITELSKNVTKTLIGDYKKVIFGILLISYGIFVPIIDKL